jgi:uncharacterized sporulation protein YeaH/YhbH (DUF444 family)
MFEISSNDSEGAFNEFIDEQLDQLIDGILNDGTLENLAGRGSDIVVEMDDIEPPQFVHADEQEGSGGGEGGQGPGQGGGKLRFSMPFHFLMEKLAGRLNLPNLTKQGAGTIHDWTEQYKTFGPVGVVMDRRRTFKRALKSSIALGSYRPDEGKYDIMVKRKDRRYRQFEMVEKPRYKAVVFYMSDISYSTYGKRMEMEKKIISFIQSWLDYNYGVKNVEHRFFVHDAKAYEVIESEFYKVSNAGGTRAAPVFELVQSVAMSEYDPSSTNFYGFYFGDGELFDDDPAQITSIIGDQMRPYFNRVGVVEVMPSSYSNLVKKLKSRFANDSIVRLSEFQNQEQIIPVIKNLFRAGFEEIHA